MRRRRAATPPAPSAAAAAAAPAPTAPAPAPTRTGGRIGRGAAAGAAAAKTPKSVCFEAVCKDKMYIPGAARASRTEARRDLNCYSKSANLKNTRTKVKLTRAREAPRFSSTKAAKATATAGPTGPEQP